MEEEIEMPKDDMYTTLAKLVDKYYLAYFPLLVLIFIGLVLFLIKTVK